jgi:hypothetical protein
MNIARSEFLKKLIQIMLATLLAVIAFTLANRTVSGSDCSKCPGNGICKGETDCSKFLPGQK